METARRQCYNATLPKSCRYPREGYPIEFVHQTISLALSTTAEAFALRCLWRELASLAHCGLHGRALCLSKRRTYSNSQNQLEVLRPAQSSKQNKYEVVWERKPLVLSSYELNSRLKCHGPLTCGQRSIILIDTFALTNARYILARQGQEIWCLFMRGSCCEAFA